MGTIPQGIYKTTALLDIDAQHNITIKFIGRISAYGCSGIKISGKHYITIENLDITLYAIDLTHPDWTADFSGLEVFESSDDKIDIKRIGYYQKGITLSTNG